MNRRFETADWLIVGGGLVLLAASVVPWWTLRIANVPGVSLNAYDFAVTGTVPVILLLSVTVLTVIIKTDNVGLPDWLVHPYLSTLAVVATAGLLTVRFLWSGFEDTERVSRGFGMYLALAGVAISLVGCVLALRALGRPRPDVVDEDDDDDDDEEDGVAAYGYVDYEEEDDLVRRFNTNLPSGETPVYRRGGADAAPRRVPPTRQPSSRRRPSRAVAPPSTDLPRPPSPGPPLP